MNQHYDLNSVDVFDLPPKDYMGQQQNVAELVRPATMRATLRLPIILRGPARFGRPTGGDRSTVIKNDLTGRRGGHQDPDAHG